MDPIDAFIERRLARYQQTEPVLEAKQRLSEVMHYAYQGYQNQGLAADQAMEEVLEQFGYMGTSWRLLKVDTSIFIPLESDSHTIEEVKGNTFPKITMAEAQEFTAVKRRTQPLLAAGIALLILSPIVLLQTSRGGLVPMLGAVSAGNSIGMVFTLLVAGVGALMLYRRRYELSAYPRILSGEFTPDSQVTTWITEIQTARDQREANWLMLSIGMWITALIPILIGVIAADTNRVLGLSRTGLTVTILMIATGFFVNLAGAWASSAAKYLTGQKFGTARLL